MKAEKLTKRKDQGQIIKGRCEREIESMGPDSLSLVKDRRATRVCNDCSEEAGFPKLDFGGQSSALSFPCRVIPGKYFNLLWLHVLIYKVDRIEETSFEGIKLMKFHLAFQVWVV